MKLMLVCCVVTLQCVLVVKASGIIYRNIQPGYPSSDTPLLTSPNGQYVMYFDGYAATIEQSDGQVIWRATAAAYSASMSIGDDGNLCLDGGSWCTYTQNSNCPQGVGAQYAQLSDGGQLLVYNAAKEVIWVSVPDSFFATVCCTDSYNGNCEKNLGLPYTDWRP